VLVTGGAGFVGSAATESLLQSGRNVVLLDNYTGAPYPRAWKQANLQRLQLVAQRARRSLVSVVGDCTSREDVASAFTADVAQVLHLAAQSGLSPGVKAEDLFSANVGSTCVVLDAAAQRGIPTVLASSAAVYGDDGSGLPHAFLETHPATAPLSVYAASKRAAELATFALCQASPCTILRLFTVYGPRGRPDMAPYCFIRDILAGKPLTVFGDCSAWRDYVFIDDVVDALLTALDRSPVSGVETFNVSSGVPVRLHEFVAAVEKACGSEAKLNRLPGRPGDVGGTLGDRSKAERVLGWRASVSLDDGLRRTVAWWRSPDADAYRTN